MKKLNTKLSSLIRSRATLVLLGVLFGVMLCSASALVADAHIITTPSRPGVIAGRATGSGGSDFVPVPGTNLFQLSFNIQNLLPDTTITGVGFAFPGTLTGFNLVSGPLNFSFASGVTNGFGTGQTFDFAVMASTPGAGVGTNQRVTFVVTGPSFAFTNLEEIFDTVYVQFEATGAGGVTEVGRAVRPPPAPTPTPAQNSVVQFNSSNYSVVEACTSVTITVNRVGDTSSAASVNYSTSDVTASERSDYITAIGTLRFASGEASKSFAVLINDDFYVEGPETFNVNLSNPSGVSLGGPAIATVTINDNPTEPATNVIDDPQNFACQHYHDFLNRQPDASGLAFWTKEITSCGADQACLALKRLNVSAAFYSSIEFQQTGYLVERLYKTAFGDASGTSTFGGAHQLPVPIVRFKELLADTQQIGQGVVVGQTGWETVLENNKQGFTSEFLQRARFTTAFPASLTPAQFVDGLFANAGVTPSTTERNTAIAEFGAATNTSDAAARSRTLRDVAENPTLNQQEFNRAFVLMEYFGYLRRNPNDAPDADYTGYEFWLTKLNQSNGNFVNAETVKAFITSGEYRQRFGS